MLATFSDEVLTLPKATILGVAEEVSESIVDKNNPGTETNLTEPTEPPRKRKNEALYEKLLRGKLDHLSQEDTLSRYCYDTLTSFMTTGRMI
jgi:hypothetical protein